MLIPDYMEEIEKAEDRVFSETIQMLEEFSKAFEKMDLHILVSLEGWCYKKRRIKKINRDSGLSGDRYESVLAIYPFRGENVLKEQVTGIIPCATVMFQRGVHMETEWKITEDGRSVPKLRSQMSEILEGMEGGGYIPDEKETKRLKRDAKLIKMI